MSSITWQDFKSYVDEHIPKQRCFLSRGPKGFSRPLFRGHASSHWNLESTLARRGEIGMPILRYMQNCSSARRLSGNYSPASIPFDEQTSFKYEDLNPNFPNYEYLAFLRHHGFPSPLLDWTESPYIAAFFAFRSLPPDGSATVRVYLYYSDTGSGRGYCTSNPHILVLGPFATVHERHAVQQCWYTVAVSDNSSNCIFESHEAALATSKADGGQQDSIQIFDISTEDREEALADLHLMNISAYTLFRTSDTLFETAAHRIFKAEKA